LEGGKSVGIVEIVVIVLIVLFIVGYFGRGRFRA
jgi:flagellar basal body-associated protein FliL